MNCPRCSAILTRIEYEGVPICACRGCGGEFVDYRRLRVIEKRKEIHFDKAEVARLKGGKTGPTREVRLPCPRCGNSMAKGRCRDIDVVIDYCKACSGIWLDDGELEKIQILFEQKDLIKSEQSRGRDTLAVALAKALPAVKEQQGESTQGQGYAALDPYKSSNVFIPLLWVRGLKAALLFALFVGWQLARTHVVPLLEHLFGREDAGTAHLVVSGALIFVSAAALSTFTKVSIQPGVGLAITRYLVGFPWKRQYSRDVIDCLGTDYRVPFMLASLNVILLLTVYGYGAQRFKESPEPSGKSYLYVVLKSGRHICIYSGRDDTYVAKLSDLLQSGLGVRVRRL